MTYLLAKAKPGTAEKPRPGDARGNTLLRAARRALEQGLGGDGRPSAELPEPPAWLLEPGACFVTLLKKGELRGCIGSLEASRPLIEDLRRNALAAATNDPRFSPLTAAELPQVRLEVSILSPTEPVAHHSEESLRSALRPGADGICLRWRGHQATFLPQVWQELPTAHEFLACLRRKAGLAENFWASDLQIRRYTVESFFEI